MTPLKALVGTLPTDRSAFTARMRFHQGWWRAFVLNLPEGPRPNDPTQVVCNAIADGSGTRGNFLTEQASMAVGTALARRNGASAGIVDERRLRCNLLSSQPLAFNFFGHLAEDLDLATLVFFPLFGIRDAEVTAIHFEYSPGKPAGDNSAFDVAVEYRRAGRKGLVGVECKYTDTFSPTEYKRGAYEDLYQAASSTFNESYDILTSSRFNQLFRNQLVGEGLRRRGDFDEVHVRLFCAPGDKEGRSTGEVFSKMINASEATSFGVITYEDFISTAQQQPLEWADREWTMLLWARYCGMLLSDRAYREVTGGPHIAVE